MVAGPSPPLFGQCPKEIDFSFGGLSLCRHFSFCLPPLLCTVDQFFLLIPSESRLKNPNTCRRKSGVHSTQLLGRRWEPNCSQNPGIAKIWLTSPPPHHHHHLFLTSWRIWPTKGRKCELQHFSTKVRKSFLRVK